MGSGRKSHKFQAPKGTRDFPPAEMAVRRHVESAWREVATNHGFDEIDGPTFEHLELYTVKSGPGIVSELLSFRRAGGDTDYALRPELTPTIARMYAAAARSLPRPTRWFSIASMFRAERPQRGRLREHIQWNVDLIGDPTPRGDAEIIAVVVAFLSRLGLTPEHVRVKLSDRLAIEAVLRSSGVAADRLVDAFNLVDAISKLPSDEFRRRAGALGLPADDPARWAGFESWLAVDRPAADCAVAPGANPLAPDGVNPGVNPDTLDLPDAAALHGELAALDLLEWCDYKPSLARGLAYYTGTVFEIHEARGRERAVAGGGRYDQLVELFGGPPTPAVGFAMGDVVIRLVLEEHGLLEPAETYRPRPDAFVIDLREGGEAERTRLVTRLRRAGLHVRHSARATRNIGKLLGEAGQTRARFALILLAGELDAGKVGLKNLDTGDQEDVTLDTIVDTLRARRGLTP